MKTYSFLAAMIATAIALPVQSADLLGADVDLGYWFSDSKINSVKDSSVDTSVSLSASLEHFIPLVPNAKIAYNNISGDHNLDYSQYDLIAYYEILDNDLLSFDLGLNLQHYNGHFRGLNLDIWQPNLYSRAAIGVPGLPVSIFGSFSYGSLDNVSTVDLEAGVSYSLNLVAANLDVSLGYRMQDNDFGLSVLGVPVSKIETSGFFIGVSVGI